MGQSWNQPLSRRRLLAGAAGGVMVAGIGGNRVLAHGPVESSAAKAAKAAIRRARPLAVPTPREETLIIQMGTNENFDNFNPFVPNGETIMWGVHQLAREPFFIDNLVNGDWVPWLATDFGYNDDYTALTIDFHPDATWNDGEPFTSDDVRFTFEMLAENEELYGNTSANFLTDIETPDDHTIVLGLSEPSPRWHYGNLTASDWSQWIRIVPRHIWEGEDPETFQFNPPIYTGPYTLVEANPQTLMYVWERNETYWNSDREYGPKYVVYMQDLPVDAQIAEFAAGNLDIGGFDYLNQQALIAGGYENAVTASYPDPCPRALMPNNLSRLFQHPEARWALSLLVDREVIASTIMQPPTMPAQYPWANYGSSEDFEVPELAEEYDLTEFNPDKAAELLDSIGCTLEDGADWRTLDGEELRLSMITSVPAGENEFQIAEMVVQEAQNIGLNMELVNLQGATYDAALQEGEYDVQSGWMCPGISPAAAFSEYALDPEGDEAVTPIGEQTDTNEERIDITELWPYVEAIAAMPAEEAAGSETFAEALELYFQHLPKVPTVQTMFQYVMNTTYWTGWPTDDDPHGPAKFDLQTFQLTLPRLRPAE